MSTPAWALRLNLAGAAAAGQLRLLPGVQVCAESESVWLRGPASEDDLHWQLAAVPGARRYTVLDDGQLLPMGRRVPQGRLPGGPWVPVTEWIKPECPATRAIAACTARVPLSLQRSAMFREPSLLVTAWDIWATYAVEAPQVRLDRWRFALAEDGRTVIHGLPLPPLPGERWTEQEGIAVPAGWTWTPAVEAAIVCELFGLATGDVALWYADGHWERIAADAFVRATRAAVRESGQGRG